MNTSAFSKNLGVYGPPQERTRSSSTPTVPVKSSNVAQFANLATQILPVAVDAYNQNAEEQLNSEVSGALFKIYESRNQGLMSSAEAQVQYKSKILEFKKNNPDKLKRIDEVVNSTLGFNPIQESEKREFTSINQAVDVYNLINPGGKDKDGNRVSYERQVELGQGLLSRFKEMDMLATAATRDEKSRKQASIQVENILFQEVASEALNSTLQNLATDLSTLYTTPGLDSKTDANLNKMMVDLQSAFQQGKGNLLTAFSNMMRKQDPNGNFIYSKFDQTEMQKNLIERYDNRVKVFTTMLTDAKANGTLESITRQVKILDEMVGLKLKESMPMLHMTEMIGGPELREKLYQSIRFGQVELLEKVKDEVEATITKVITGDETPPISKFTVDKVFTAVSKEGTTLTELGLQNPEDKRKAITFLGEFVVNTLGNKLNQKDPTQQSKNQLVPQHTAVLNAMGLLNGVANSINLTRAKSLDSVTNIYGENAIKFLNKTKVNHPEQTERVADQANALFFKSFNINAADAVGKGGIVFNQGTGKYEPKEINPTGLSASQQGKYSQAMGNGSTPLEAGLISQGLTLEDVQGKIKTLNTIVEKMYRLKDFSNSLGAFTDIRNFADGLNQTLVFSPIPYKQGQAGIRKNNEIFLKLPDTEIRIQERNNYVDLFKRTAQGIAQINIDFRGQNEGTKKILKPTNKETQSDNRVIRYNPK